MKSIRLYLAALALLLGGAAQAATEFHDGQTLYFFRSAQMMGGMVAGVPSDTTAYGLALRMTSAGYLKIAEQAPAYNYSSLTNIAQNIAVNFETVVKTQVAPLPEYTSLEVHVAWTYADTTAATADSLQLELIPYSKISSANDGIEMPIDLDPLTPGIQGMYVTRPTSPLPVWGCSVDSTRAVFTAGSTASTFWCSKPALARFAPTPTALWASADSLAISIAGTRGAHFTAIGLGGATLSGIAVNTFAAFVTNFYLDPPVKIYANDVYNGSVQQALKFSQWSPEGRIGSGFVSFPLTVRNGAWIKEPFLGFYVVNHSATKNLTNVTIDVWPKVN